MDNLSRLKILNVNLPIIKSAHWLNEPGTSILVPFFRCIVPYATRYFV